MERADGRHPIGGFTLFEVMAAVLVLGILYTTLMGTQAQGMRAESESKRRLEASLLADVYLAGIEAGIAAGVFPEVGITQEEVEGGYQIDLEVAPFDPIPYLGKDFAEALPKPGDPTPTLLAAPARPEESFLRSVIVSVRWMEPEGEHEARRTTLAYDPATVESMFPEEEGEAAAPPEEAGAEDGGSLNPDGDPMTQELLDRLFPGGMPP